MNGRTRIRYSGPARGAAILADMLTKEGLEVSVESTRELRSAEGNAVLALLYVTDKIVDATVGLGVEGTIRRIVHNFQERFQKGAEIEIRVDEHQASKD